MKQHTAHIRACKWSESMCQRDMTTAYQCVHQSALDEQAKGEFADTLCLGLTETCPHFEEAIEEEATV